jgi:hypothetical protein
VYYKPSSSWVKIYDNIADFGLGPTNEKWKIDRLTMKPFHYSSGSWTDKSGSLSTRIEVGPSDVWTIESSNAMKRYTSSWTSRTEKAREIGIGAEGSVFIINTTETAFTGYTV